MILVDSNVVLGLLLEGGFSTAARALFRKDADWHSEDLVLYEVTNALATQHRVLGLDLLLAQRMLVRAQELLLKTRHHVADADALAAAATFGISGYDARFIVLARALGVKLTTEDARLRRAVPAYTQSIADALAA